MKFLIVLTLLMYSAHAAEKYVAHNLKPLTDEMVNALNTMNLTWKAGNNFNGNTIEINNLVSTIDENYDNQVAEKFFYSETSYPESFDARQVWPNCTSIGKVYDQKKGYPSWIYAAVGSVADRLCIQTGVQIDVELTVERIVTSNGGFNSSFNSANLGQAFNYYFRNGIYTVKSRKEPSCLPLATECKLNKMKLDKYFQVSIQSPVDCASEMQDLMLNGPLPSYIQIYPDFLSYKSGVYQPATRNPLGMHNVKLIGWGTENGIRYWLATNSWGQDWGENGIFKIQQCLKHGEFKRFGEVPHSFSAKFTESNNSYFGEGQLFDLA